jgi:hypothetical protein
MLTIIAATAASVSRADEKLTAFLELESAIRDMQPRFQTLFAMRRKVSGRNGKRSASPDYPERRPQPKQEKKII